MRAVALVLLSLLGTIGALRLPARHPRTLVLRLHDQRLRTAVRQPRPVMKAKKAPASSKEVMVVLLSEVKGIGKKGEVVKVKPAYAQNVLLGKGLGKMATDDVLAQIEKDKADAAAAAVAALAKAKELATKLDEIFGTEGAVIKKKVGPSGDIFGKVSGADLATHIKSKSGIDLDRKQITVPAIKGVGSAIAKVKLHKEVEIKLTLKVVADS